MVELIGDTCMPSTLVAPEQENYPTTNALSGTIVLSGTLLCYFDGSAWQTIAVV